MVQDSVRLLAFPYFDGYVFVPNYISVENTHLLGLAIVV